MPEKLIDLGEAQIDMGLDQVRDKVLLSRSFMEIELPKAVLRMNWLNHAMTRTVIKGNHTPTVFSIGLQSADREHRMGPHLRSHRLLVNRFIRRTPKALDRLPGQYVYLIIGFDLVGLKLPYEKLYLPTSRILCEAAAYSKKQVTACRKQSWPQVHSPTSPTLSVFCSGATRLPSLGIWLNLLGVGDLCCFLQREVTFPCPKRK